jgi:Ohr subfamily peroxiredoxin
MKHLYTAEATVVGGREGHAKSSDGRLEVDLAPPKELGGNPKPNATNPEQLFAAGYAACFESAVRHVARGKGVKLTLSKVEGKVDLHANDDGSFGIAATLTVSLPELDTATGNMLLEEAHRVCPYSNATRGNIPVKLILTEPS